MSSVVPMLDTLTEERFSREGRVFEPKWDGERCLVFRHGGELRVYSRHRKLLNERYPELVAAFRRQENDSFIADGEIVTFQDGVTSFAKLQQRMQLERPPLELVRKVPVWFYLFDLLYLDRYDIRKVPLKYRKELLRKTLEFKDRLQFTEHRETEGGAYYRQACRRHWEGVIAKNEDSVYVSRRTRDWLKFKCRQEQEFVIVGYTDPQGKRIGFGALLVGYYHRGKLVYAGKVGTGFDTARLQQLGSRLAQLETATCPFVGDEPPRQGVHCVKPELVAQIGFTEWTPGGKLRHAWFLGLRDDKRPEGRARGLTPRWIADFRFKIADFDDLRLAMRALNKQCPSCLLRGQPSGILLA
ncbi:MAG TPA: non-homologous end-joining DNA ligase [Gemmataceae bacterium]|nr:non-homologous end-joining DNA ligase [Gemmataceae bacterium]